MKRKRNFIIILALVVVLAVTVFAVNRYNADKHNKLLAIQQRIDEWNAAKIMGAQFTYKNDEEGFPVFTSKIDYNTTDVLLNVAGFNKVNGYDFSLEQYRRLLSNGTKRSVGYTPLSPAAIGNLTEQQQLKVYSAFSDFTESSSVAKSTYINRLDAFYAANRASLIAPYQGKYNNLSLDRAETLPPEVAQAVIAAYNKVN